MATYTIIGAGLQGTAIAYYLCRRHSTELVTVVDNSIKRLVRLEEVVGSLKTKGVIADARSKERLIPEIQGRDVLIGAASYDLNVDLTRMAIATGTNFIDLGGNNDVVEVQFLLSDAAERRGCTIIPDCGLAPGLVSELAALGINELAEEDYEPLDVRLRVGGLPQDPKGPLKYALVFSVKGLINEYIEESVVIEDGIIKTIPSLDLDNLESISFGGFPDLEAFPTSGGTSTLPETYLGKVRNLDYKTIRYAGHCRILNIMNRAGFFADRPLQEGQRIKEVTEQIIKKSRAKEVRDIEGVLSELGFFKRTKLKKEDATTIRELSEEILQRALYDPSQKDVVLLRATITGEKGSKSKEIAYEMVERYDKETGLSAMQRTTGFPAAIIAEMIANTEIHQRGVLKQELFVPGEKLLERLSLSGVTINKRVDEKEKDKK